MRTIFLLCCGLLFLAAGLFFKFLSDANTTVSTSGGKVDTHFDRTDFIISGAVSILGLAFVGASAVSWVGGRGVRK
jgi:hypothetical protein